MNKTVIIYKALYDTVITLMNGRKQPVKSGEFIAYDTANNSQFTIREQEINEKFIFVHNDQYMRKALA